MIALLLAIPAGLLGVEGPWRYVLISAATVVGVGYAAFGPSSRIELRDGSLRRRFLGRGTDIDLRDVTEVDVFWVPNGPLQMSVRSPDGLIGFAVVDSSESFRRALGQELRNAGKRGRCTRRAAPHLHYPDPRL